MIVEDEAPGARPAEAPPGSTLRAAAIINPVSCPLGSDPMRAAVARALARHNVECSFDETCETETALPLAKRAIENGAELILAVGGDGTVMESLRATLGTNTRVGIIPAGTGNLLATNLGIPIDTAEAVEVAVTGRATQIDLVSVDNGREYFAIMGGFGYDAEIMRGTSREVKRKIGKLAYLWTALRDIRGRRFRALITLDSDRKIAATAKDVLIGNMGQLVKGFSLFPDADPADGQIEVGIIKAATVPEFFHLIWNAMRGRPQASPYFDTYCAKRVEIRAVRPTPFELDGEDRGDLAQVVCEVMPKAATVMLPTANTVS